MIDIHCHILPGLDDGARDLDESVEFCRIALEDGIRTIVATPHMFDGLYSVARNDIFKAIDRLRRRLEKEGIDLEIVPGAETHVAFDLPNRIERKEIVTLADGGRYILLELPPEIVPMGLNDLLFRLRLSGFTAILAHPERNYAIQSNPEILDKIVEAGHLSQLTADSITGGFGEQAEQCSQKLLRAGLCHMVASDAHSIPNRPPVLSEARKEVRRLVGKEGEKAVFEENPARAVKGSDVTASSAAPSPLSNKRKAKWLRGT